MPMQGSTVKGYTFVGCPAMLGRVRKQGPVTGKTWEVTPMGVWIDEDDAACLTEIREMVYCMRAMCEIPTYTVFGLSASYDQVQQLERMLSDGC